MSAAVDSICPPKEAVPVAQGLFEGQGDATRLLASRCQGCASVYFPRSLSCRHPRCIHKQLEDVALGPQGTLYSYTVQAYRPPALFVMDDWAPYAIGLVELPEGLRVMAMLSDGEASSWRIGMPLVLGTRALYRDAQGRAVLTYTFRPLASEGAPA